MTVRMRVVRGRLCGKCVDFSDGEFVLGRGPECRIRVGSKRVSRQHCLLRIHGPKVRVRDLGSTNGTLVNGTLIVEECVLRQGDTLQLGPLVLEVILQGQDPRTPTTSTHEPGEMVGAFAPGPAMLSPSAVVSTREVKHGAAGPIRDNTETV